MLLIFSQVNYNHDHRLWFICFPKFRFSDQRKTSQCKTGPCPNKKIAAAIYEYQADCDGEWGELSLNFEAKTAAIIRLADWDTIKSNKYAKAAISYLLYCKNENCPKDIVIPFEY